MVINKEKNIQWIYLAKGIAIFLVVLGHIFRGLSATGNYGEYTSIFSYIDFTIYSFHMPLFFIISGFLYTNGGKISNIKEYIYFIKKKAYTIMVPYFIFSWIQIIIKLLMSTSVNSQVNYRMFFSIVYEPIEQFWFLYSLMIIFILIGFIDLYIKNEKIKFLFVVMLFGVGNIQSLKNPIFLTSFSNLLYFYLGEILYKINLKKNIFTKRYFMVGILLTYFTFNVICYNKFYFRTNIATTIVLAIVGSSLIISLCIIEENKKGKFIRAIKKMGSYSMSIYLLHVIFTAGTRIILSMIGVMNLFVQVVLQSILGIICPIVLGYTYSIFKGDLYKNKESIKEKRLINQCFFIKLNN